MIIRVCIILILFSTAQAYGDIYKYVDEYGVECYTDMPRNGAALVMKTAPSARKPSWKEVAKTGSASARLATAKLSGSLPVQGRITSTVGLRTDPIDGTPRYHNGVDIAIPEGTRVRPVGEGTVIYSGWRGGYGNAVAVAHPDGTTTIYAHNKINLVSVGEQVDSSATIAYSGSTGRSTGPHLHFEAWRDGANVTSEFMGSMAAGDSAPPYRQVALRPNPVRTAVLPDGSVLYTNLPYSHP
jgi:murein DD-endopeptidase MepM/ murein hydrolase activator NlpD